MARTAQKAPVPYLRQDKSSIFKMRWTVRENGKNSGYQIALGTISTKSTESIYTACKFAFDGKHEFPEEMRSAPALMRHLAAKANNDALAPEAELTDKYHTFMTIKCTSK